MTETLETAVLQTAPEVPEVAIQHRPREGRVHWQLALIAKDEAAWIEYRKAKEGREAAAAADAVADLAQDLLRIREGFAASPEVAGHASARRQLAEHTAARLELLARRDVLEREAKALADEGNVAAALACKKQL